MSARAADVIIVGGGIMGAATAFFLAKRGRSVILLERDLIGQYASGTNFGNVRRQGRFLPQLPLANRSREIWGRLPALIGEDVEFLPSGHVRVAFGQGDADQLESYAQEARRYDLELEILSGNRLRDRFPFLSTQAVAGSYSPLDGHANPRLAAPAFGRAARRACARLNETTEDDANEWTTEALQGVTHGAPAIRAPA
ncbi:MAG: NAD(P)/FAD-dependent oxidoreductase, partial [Hyphomicrobiales bacterium]